jgi:acyl-CoA thioesterase-1
MASVMMLRLLTVVWIGWSLIGPVRAVAENGPVVLVLGDSLSAGYGIALEQGWVALLQERIRSEELPHQVVNAAISGDTTDGGRSRLPGLLTRHQPVVVIVELGANDGLRGFPPSQIERNLVELVGEAQSAGAAVLVAGVRLPPNYGAAYTAAFQRVFGAVADQTDAVLVPRLLEGISDDRSLMQADEIHPTAAAQPKILDNLWPVLFPLLMQTADR